MNPFTHFLARYVLRRPLHQFINHWDALEALVIQVYKTGAVTATDEATYQQVRAWMQRHYAAWEEALRPHWQVAQAGGEPVSQDPFRLLIRPEKATAFVGNWAALQTLPAAREALNRLIMAERDRPPDALEA